MNFIQRWKLKRLYKKALIFANTRKDLTSRINCSLYWYQEKARIYLDEFPEIEECDLRVNFDTSLLMKRFMVKE